MPRLDAFGDEGGEGCKILSEADGSENAAQIFVRMDVCELKGGCNGRRGMRGTADVARDDGHGEDTLKRIFVNLPYRERFVRT